MLQLDSTFATVNSVSPPAITRTPSTLKSAPFSNNGRSSLNNTEVKGSINGKSGQSHEVVGEEWYKISDHCYSNYQVVSSSRAHHTRFYLVGKPPSSNGPHRNRYRFAQAPPVNDKDRSTLELHLPVDLEPAARAAFAAAESLKNKGYQSDISFGSHYNSSVKKKIDRVIRADNRREAKLKQACILPQLPSTILPPCNKLRTQNVQCIVHDDKLFAIGGIPFNCQVKVPLVESLRLELPSEWNKRRKLLIRSKASSSSSHGSTHESKLVASSSPAEVKQGVKSSIGEWRRYPRMCRKWQGEFCCVVPHDDSLFIFDTFQPSPTITTTPAGEPVLQNYRFVVESGEYHPISTMASKPLALDRSNARGIYVATLGGILIMGGGGYGTKYSGKNTLLYHIDTDSWSVYPMKFPTIQITHHTLIPLYDGGLFCMEKGTPESLCWILPSHAFTKDGCQLASWIRVPNFPGQGQHVFGLVS
jgi:hypothetical protein